MVRGISKFIDSLLHVWCISKFLRAHLVLHIIIVIPKILYNEQVVIYSPTRPFRTS